MPGPGDLTLTGLLGDVMRSRSGRQSPGPGANAGRYGLDAAEFRGTDLHVHAQPAAEAKDGASAGVALVAALVSSFTRRPVRADLGMSGEITLSGHVLPVAGVKEKVAGACRRGLTRVVLPRQNEEHFERDVGDDIRRRITVDYVRRIDDVLDLVLLPAEAANDRSPEPARVRL